MSEEAKNPDIDGELSHLIEQVIASETLGEDEKVSLFRRALQMIKEDRHNKSREVTGC